MKTRQRLATLALVLFTAATPVFASPNREGGDPGSISRIVRILKDKLLKLVGIGTNDDIDWPTIPKP
jgi:hypothetical protein